MRTASEWLGRSRARREVLELADLTTPSLVVGWLRPHPPHGTYQARECVDPSMHFIGPR